MQAQARLLHTSRAGIAWWVASTASDRLSSELYAICSRSVAGAMQASRITIVWDGGIDDGRAAVA